MSKFWWNLRVLVTPDCWYRYGELDIIDDNHVWTELENGGCVFEEDVSINAFNDDFLLFNGVSRIIDAESSAVGSVSYGRCLRRRTRVRFVHCLSKRTRHFDNDLDNIQCKRMFNGMTHDEVSDVLSKHVPEKLL